MEIVFFNFDANHNGVCGTATACTLSSIMNDFNSFLHPMIANSRAGCTAAAPTLMTPAVRAYVMSDRSLSM